MNRVMIPETENPQKGKSVRVSLHGNPWLIRVDNVGYLAGRLIYVTCNNANQSNRLHTVYVLARLYKCMGNCVVVPDILTRCSTPCTYNMSVSF